MAELLVGLTGGVGSGKSAAGALFAARGATLLDADLIAREVVEPGTPGLAAVAARFGPEVIETDGRLNRPALAAIVFADSTALADLNAIVHPLVRARTDELLAAVPDGVIAVYEVPLLAEGGPLAKRDFDVVVVIEAALAVRLTRLEARGLPPDQAKARIAAQASDDERRALGDFILVNDGSREELAERVEAVWAQLLERIAGPGPSTGTVSKPVGEIR